MLFTAASAFAVAMVSAPAEARMSMPGMHLPMPTKPAAKVKSAPKKKPTANKASAQTPAAKAKFRRARSATKTTTHATMPGTTGAMSMPMPANGQPAKSGTMPMNMPMPMSQSPGQQGQMTMPMGGHGDHMMNMNGAFGSYRMQRESSGTAWQPDTTEHAGLMTTSGDWTLMAHGVLNLVYDHQSGPRGDDKAFASGMLMGMARRPLGQGTLQLKAMLSPDPLMGPSGYPLLLASGETANGRDRLVDRQHPHEFVMELSASVSQNIGSKSSAFLYAGLPGEPAFGPPAFMHRESIMDSPEAPISHHWLDSTHISFGVVTAGDRKS